MGGGIGTQGLYSIESSEDLLTWTPGPDVSPDILGRLVFTDLSAPGVSRRFYRPRRLGAEGILTPGSALSFDGAARSVQVPHSAALNSYPLTVSAWIKTASTSASVAGIVSKYADASFNGWSIFLSGGRLYAWYSLNVNRQVFTPPWGLQSASVADGQWHHIALVIGDSGGTLYVDGVSQSHLPWTGTPGAATTTAPLQIGRYHNYPNGFAGEIDEVSVWSTALSDIQILDLRRRGPTGTEANLEALWTFDDGTGTQLNDATAAGHHGTRFNSPAWVESTAPVYR